MQPNNCKRILLCSLAALIIALNACNPGREDRAGSRTPNFIIIYTDEMEFNDLGCYGGNIPTPNIDKLAAEGILFLNAYTTASMCTPSRYSVLTGQFPGRCSAPSFLKNNPPNQPYNIAWNSWITADKKTLPRILSEHGFITGMAGKWHVGQVPDGIELPEFLLDERLDHPETEAKLIQQQAVYQELVEHQGGFDEAASVVWGNYDGHELEALQFHNFPWMVKGAMTFIERQKENSKPFFFYFAPTAVHGPNHVADLNRDITYTPGGRDTTLSQLQIDVAGLKEYLAQADPKTRHRVAGMAQTDHVIGLIREKLDQTGLAENTVIIFISDHNIEPGKATSFEKGIHVPMIVYWPGEEPGSVRNALVQNIDIYPTILETAGIEPPRDYPLDGVSMLPIISDPERSTREFIFTENGYTRSVSDGSSKYIALRYPDELVKKMESGEIDHVPSHVKAWPQAHSAIAMNGFPHYFDQDQFYHLKDDPYEQDNLYGIMNESDELKKLVEALGEHLASFNHPFDLSQIPFLETDAYRRLTQNNKAFDLLSIPWLSRDHGFINWPPEDTGAVFKEAEGMVTVEAEDFYKQTKSGIRKWYRTSVYETPGAGRDDDPPHVAGASNGAYLEILPDTRATHEDKLIAGENFSNEPGRIAILHYRVTFNTPGKYYVWVRAYSTGSEDNGLHVGLNDEWPESGQRLQWCEGKNSWRWESKQRTQEVHCGEPFKIFLEIREPGQHEIQFSMREDGFEFDKFLMTTDKDFQPGDDAGPDI